MEHSGDSRNLPLNRWEPLLTNLSLNAELLSQWLVVALICSMHA
jgi:hypothetical protein